MNLTSPSQVKAWCIANGFHPNRVLGQNFLIDRNALTAIVDAGLENCRDAAPQALEIGPGLGVLTEELLKRGCRVTAVEKDPVLAGRLKESLGSPAGLTVVAADALDWIAGQSLNGPTPAPRGESPRVLSTAQTLSGPTTFSCMGSNLPYQAGTRILLELVKTRALPSLTVLVQTEVAERLAAGPGSKTRGLAGVWAQLDYDVRVVRKVSASCFWPRPAVGSSVVRLDRHDRNLSLSAEARKLFHRLTKQAFEHRRKQLGKIFRDLIQSTARAEELSNEEWIELTKGLMNEDAGRVFG